MLRMMLAVVTMLLSLALFAQTDPIREVKLRWQPDSNSADWDCVAPSQKEISLDSGQASAELLLVEGWEVVRVEFQPQVGCERWIRNTSDLSVPSCIAHPRARSYVIADDYPFPVRPTSGEWTMQVTMQKIDGSAQQTKEIPFTVSNTRMTSLFNESRTSGAGADGYISPNKSVDIDEIKISVTGAQRRIVQGHLLLFSPDGNEARCHISQYGEYADDGLQHINLNYQTCWKNLEREGEPRYYPYTIYLTDAVNNAHVLDQLTSGFLDVQPKDKDGLSGLGSIAYTGEENGDVLINVSYDLIEGAAYVRGRQDSVPGCFQQNRNAASLEFWLHLSNGDSQSFNDLQCLSGGHCLQTGLNNTPYRNVVQLRIPKELLKQENDPTLAVRFRDIRADHNPSGDARNTLWVFGKIPTR